MRGRQKRQPILRTCLWSFAHDSQTARPSAPRSIQDFEGDYREDGLAVLHARDFAEHRLLPFLDVAGHFQTHVLIRVLNVPGAQRASYNRYAEIQTDAREANVACLVFTVDSLGVNPDVPGGR